jgi:hypothetical protein
VSLYQLKVLAASLGLAAVGGIAGGLVYAWLGHRSVYYGIGTGLFIVSLVCLGLGLLGATEPDEGWRRGTEGRRSLVARVATEHPDIERMGPHRRWRLDGGLLRCLRVGGAMSSYFWVLEDAAGSELRWTERFDSQEDAESWMGREWATLREEGASKVVLMRDDDTMYRMGLDEE